MSSLSVSDIENSLLIFRKGRAILLEKIVGQLVQCTDIKDPFLLISRFFSRLKSADSILEKIQSKNIEINNVHDLPDKLPDILGFRIITSNPSELYSVVELLRDEFPKKFDENKIDRIKNPGEDGEREINLKLEYQYENLRVPFEVQLRTYLQHFFFLPTFHLFHKKPPKFRKKYRKDLQRFSTLLQKVEDHSQKFSTERIIDKRIALNLEILSLLSKINLVIIEQESEMVVHHLILNLTGNVEADNELIANTKIDLYSIYPNHSIVECSCSNFSTYLLNEPHVTVPVEIWKKLKL